ncbi:cyclin-like protein [Lipomyces oligophaga]|uniref:cyclin-like protein n=1 Tax=Lipomyces oligophaga TaxID=45792 RepID=UPI0034CEA6DC
MTELQILKPLCNALATPRQIVESYSQGLTAEQLDYLHYVGAQLIYTASLKLQLHISIPATAAVLFHRFHLLRGFLELDIKETALACILISSKAQEQVVDLRNISIAVEKSILDIYDQYTFPPEFDATIGLRFNRIVSTETAVLATLGFDTKVVLPFNILCTYLDYIQLPCHSLILKTAWGYINDSLRSQICILHQPITIAVTCLWIAAREHDVVVLENRPWWQVFDVDSEDMGHLLLLLRQAKHIALRLEKEVVAAEAPLPVTVDLVENLQ